MQTKKNPKWWTNENESAWGRVKAAFKRDWDQTRHDFGGKQRDLNQDVGDTVKQAAGKEAIPPRNEPVFENVEDAYRFGYGARSQYGSRYSKWDRDLEMELERDWQETYADRDWKSYRDDIRRGWDFDEEQNRSGFRKAA